MTDRWSTTERIFHAALDRPPETRAAFVAEACGSDDDLRRDVESLLRRASTTGFLEQPAMHVAAGLVSAGGLSPLTGQRIGVYSITALLGKGGMGEVYRAHDTRLRRDVAIKVLPPALSANPERLARFEREARMLASLNHPHIGMLYGVEESGGHAALVLELVEGDTLAERIAAGPVPIDQALRWAQQIADALDVAHEKGIVHRDLKPANIKVTPDDVIKVLDFGLARTFGSDIDEWRGPTITAEGTGIVGTAAYMSPEQARGQAVDKRTDVWAFGCVLYELLTGRPLFVRATITDTLAAVLQDQPDWTSLPPTLPPAVTSLLQRCLEKDVRRRRRDIGDVRADIDEAIARQNTVAPAPTRDSGSARAGVRRLRPLLAFAALAAVAALGTLAAQWMFAAPSPESSDVRFKRLTDAVGIEEMPAVSPDSKDVAFVARVDGRRQIWVRRLIGGQPLQITFDDVDHENPRWTPDSSAIVYFTPALKEGEAGALWEIPSLNGAPHRIAAALTGADVSHDGRWLATFQKSGERTDLVVLSRDGAASGQTIPIDSDIVDLSAPRWSPDDRSLAFCVGRSGWIYRLIVADVATRQATVLKTMTHMKGVAWMPDGDLVLASAFGSTMAYPPVFNLRLLSRDGSRERQLTTGEVSYEQPDIVKSGEVYTTRTFMRSDLWRFPVDGAAADNVRNGAQLTRQTGQVQTPSVSPDGSEIAFLSDSGGHANVWIARIDGSATPRPLTVETDDRVIIGLPIWAPAGDRIVYIRTETTRADLAGGTEWLVNRDSSDRRALVRGASAAWSADGRWLYYQTQDQEHKIQCISKVQVDGSASPMTVRCDAAVPAPASDGTLYFAPGGFWRANEIYKAKPENTGTPVLVTRHPLSRVPLWPTGFALSPDERWLAVPLTDNGTTNIWAIPTEGGGPYRQITDFGRRPTLIGRQVSWSRDGKFIYAAVSERDSDIVLLAGIEPRR